MYVFLYQDLSNVRAGAMYNVATLPLFKGHLSYLTLTLESLYD